MSKIRYSIKDLEHFTQIKAHTIRIWEQRYGLLTPKRTDTNIRYYSEADLKKILNIALLNNAGHKISKLAAMSEEDIIQASTAIILEQNNENESDINAIVLNLLSYSGAEIKRIIQESFSNRGMETTYVSLIAPSLVKLGLLWQVNSISVAHEHFFSNIFKEFLLSKIHNLDEPESDKTVLLFLHDQEEHEFSLLLSYYLLKQNGFQCYYFGQKVPIKELATAYEEIQPEVVFTSFTAKMGEKSFRKIEKELLVFSKKSKVFITGAQLHRFDFKISKKLKVVQSVAEFQRDIL